jgi:IS5 family transposase
LELVANPAILSGMKHRACPPEQDDLLRPRLVDMIDRRHELVRLAALIDWAWFEREWAGFFPSCEGRPATHPRLVAGLMYLQHAYSGDPDRLFQPKVITQSGDHDHLPRIGAWQGDGAGEQYGRRL